MSDLSQQINIGKELERKLIDVGIASFAELKNTGSEQAFLRLRAADPGACLNMLCALDGAIAGVRWQDGYGVFSVSGSKKQVVANYIARQKEHHKKTNFKGEFLKFLEEYSVNYDEKYVWD